MLYYSEIMPPSLYFSTRGNRFHPDKPLTILNISIRSHIRSGFSPGLEIPARKAAELRSSSQTCSLRLLIKS